MADVHNLETLLDSLLESSDDEDVTVAELLDAVGRRAHGPVLLLMGFVTISPLSLIPGANWLIALVTLIFAFQVMIGMTRPWLPSRTLEFTFHERHLEKGVELATPWAKRIDRMLRPRLTFLTDPPFIQLAALACVGAALVTFPLGLIPFGPFLPGLTLMMFGLALASRDGAFLLFAWVTLGGSVYLFVQMIPQIAKAFERFLGLIGLG